MAAKHVTVKNNHGQTAVLLLDDEVEAEADRIEYLQKLAKREDVKSVTVKDAVKRPTAAERKAEAEAKAKAEAEAKAADEAAKASAQK